MFGERSRSPSALEIALQLILHKGRSFDSVRSAAGSWNPRGPEVVGCDCECDETFANQTPVASLLCPGRSDDKALAVANVVTCNKELFLEVCWLLGAATA